MRHQVRDASPSPSTLPNVPTNTSRHTHNGLDQLPGPRHRDPVIGPCTGVNEVGPHKDNRKGTSSARRGAFVVLVGPDGVGKTTVARALIAQWKGPTAYFHFRPPIIRPMALHPPDQTDPPLTKGSPDGSQLLGWVRIMRNLVRFWSGYALRVAPRHRSGALVVADRGAYGYLVQPTALKFYGPPWLAQLAVRLLPRPHLVANLTTAPEIVQKRKQELSLKRIAQELDGWSRLPVSNLQTFDASVAPDQVARAILEALNR